MDNIKLDQLVRETGVVKLLGKQIETRVRTAETAGQVVDGGDMSDAEVEARLLAVEQRLQGTADPLARQM